MSANNVRRGFSYRSIIGRVCHFTNPATGEVIEGTYKRGRRVVKLTSLRRITNDADGGRTYDFEETVYTVPRSIVITMGPAPAKPAPVPPLLP